MAKLGHEWDWSDAFKPKRVVSQKLITIRAPSDWTEDQTREVLASLEREILNYLKIRSGLTSHLDIEVENADTTETKKRRRL